jgi:catalase
MHLFQQDGHMAMKNPVGRTNYEPNSFAGEERGPRADPGRGFHSFPAEKEGPKRRLRAESFADHYSQARQFYVSQTAVEQGHIADALVFELSKVDVPAIRGRVVAHLLNVDEALALQVADGLGLKEMPAPADAAVPTRTDLEPSDALSILKNGPDSFAGRKVGALVTDGVDATLLAALRTAVEAEGATLWIVAPKVGGVEASDGSWIEADEKVDGGPSVLFDAVALLPSTDGAALLAKNPAARDFVADAYAHMKFIAYVDAAEPLFTKTGVDMGADAGMVRLEGKPSCKGFVETCRTLRFWDRKDSVDDAG